MMREPGYYWVHHPGCFSERSGWRCEYWDGESWDIDIPDPSHFDAIGERVMSQEWVQAATDEIKRLRAKLEAATSLLRSTGRITWGYHLVENRMVYYLDGKFAGPNMDDVVSMAAEAEGGGE